MNVTIRDKKQIFMHFQLEMRNMYNKLDIDQDISRFNMFKNNLD